MLDPVPCPPVPSLGGTIAYQEGFEDPRQKPGYSVQSPLVLSLNWWLCPPVISERACVGQPSSCPFAHTQWWLMPWEAIQGNFSLHSETKPPFSERCIFSPSHLSEHHGR